MILWTRASGAAWVLAGALLTSCYGEGGAGISETDTDTGAGTQGSTTAGPDVTSGTGDPTTATTSTSSTSASTTATVSGDTTASSSGTAAETTDSDTSIEGCGDGEPDDGEACDDGNREDGDGCNADCVESGTVLWSHTSASGFGADEASGVALGDSGEVYLVGTRRLADASADVWIRRYSAAGAIEWTASRTSGAGTTDTGHAITFREDAVYVTASFGTSGAQGINIWYARYSPAGGVVWEQTLSGLLTGGAGQIPGTDRAWGVALDPAGMPVVAGQIAVNSEGSNTWLRKASEATGEPVWTQTFNGLASGNDRADDVAVDSLGNIIVGGFETDATPQTVAWLRKYDDAGVEVWTQTYVGTDTATDRVFGVATNDTDDIFVAGIQGDSLLATGARWWVGHYTPDGQTVWNDDDAGETSEGAQARAVAVLQNGDLIVVGDETIGTVKRMMVRRYDSMGSIRWTRQFSEFAAGPSTAIGVIANPDGGAYIAGSVDFGVDGPDAWVARIAP